MNVVDSSGWLEYFADGADAEFFAAAIEHERELVVPVITIYEVFKRVLAQRGADDALRAVAQMSRNAVIDVDTVLALSAAKLSFDLGLPMADSLILAIAHAYSATLWTMDKHFEGIAGVRYKSKG